MSQRIRVLIADDHAVVREGIRHVLSAAEGFDVVAEASTGAEVVRLARAHRPDVVVLDISMPEANGFRALETLHREVPGTRVLILSIHDNERYVMESVRAGADGYLCKDSSPAELRAAVQAVRRGETYYSAVMTQRLAAALQSDQERTDRVDRLASLTPREHDVLLGIVQGLTNKEVAARLAIGTRTVESHRESLMTKLGVRHVAALTRLAIEAGLLTDTSQHRES